MATRSSHLLLSVAIALMVISFGIVAIDECLNSLENIVVYEGTENIILSCGLGPGAERWTVRPTSLAVKEVQISNHTDSVSPDLTGLYAINQSGLIIRNATVYPTDGPYSTAGLYYVYFPDDNRIAIKVVVIRSGPTCTVAQSNGTIITCTIIYADHPVAQMNPTITCMADGQVYRSTEPLIKNNNDPQYYVFNSTTVIKISNSSAPTYDCRLTFDPPDLGNNPNYDYVVTSKPNFTANITEGNNDVALLAAKVTLGTVLGTLMAATAVICGLLGFLTCCPLFAASGLAIPSGQTAEDIQQLPQREWIPIPRVTRRVEYRVIPFYKQSFCKCPTPYQYRLPCQGRVVQARLVQPRATCSFERS